MGAKNGIDTLASWRGFKAHPAWDGYWQAKAMQKVWPVPNVAVLNVGGYWDQEDVLGPQEAYRTLEKADTKRWNHIERPWFANWLHGDGSATFSEAYVFEVGSNAWRTFDAWPPKEAKGAKLYLHNDGKLSFGAPTVAGRTSYTSDPKRPVPYIARPVDGTRWRQWLVEDQRFVHNRPDVVSWESEPLAADVTIAGYVTAHLFASTTGTDADRVVKLIDVYPDSLAGDAKLGGYQLMVAGDIMRGRYYKRFSAPRPIPIPANAVTPFTVDLHEQTYRFLRGHRMMVQVQSSWFPLYDRNPQTWVPNILEAKVSDFRSQLHTILHGPRSPSYVAVSVLP